jgi:DNA (cytosine-5)-methyltransferase 1
MRVLDLFSGIGGFSLGLERTGMRTVAFCEIDPYCRAVLKKHWPEIPCHADIRSLPPIGCDVITGGFPCQPWSRAGKRMGASDDRHLWPEMLGVIGREKPAWVLAENVAGIIELGLDEVLSDLETEGYSAGAFVIPACAVKAPHRRDRVWIIANAQRGNGPCDGQTGRMGWKRKHMAWDRDWESALREFRGMDDGLSYGVDRVRTLRNAIVPQIAEMIGHAILQADLALARASEGTEK